jgi:hypothetical protein
MVLHTGDVVSGEDHVLSFSSLHWLSSLQTEKSDKHQIKKPPNSFQQLLHLYPNKIFVQLNFTQVCPNSKLWISAATLPPDLKVFQ